MIIQKIVVLEPRSRGIHIITEQILKEIPEINNFKAGIINLFILHTSASLSINENYDNSVLDDMELFFKKLVPDNTNYFTHTDEGSDDMTSHIKASIFGASLNIPLKDGKLLLGTWQGIYLCEHRESKRARSIAITIMGE
jgi:secondary thiamine-phosphate synthase enzyme